MMHTKYRSVQGATRSVRASFFVAIGLTIASAQAQSVQEEALGESVERQLSKDEALTQWVSDADRVNREAGDMIIATQVTKEEIETVKLRNVIPPIRFESGVAGISPQYIEALRKVLDDMRDHRNVRLHLVGHADDQPLSGMLAQRYGDNAGLSRERAGEVAEFLKSRLNLRPEAISYEWFGDAKPVATNLTDEGRALNRRVEVEVWYDATGHRAGEEEVLLRENFRRMKVCRMETVCRMRFVEGHARRARIRNLVPALRYTEEGVQVTDAFVAQVRKTLLNLQDKQNVVVKFTGFTDDLPLAGRDERIYGTHLALSKARAQRVALDIQGRLGLPMTAVASDGRGEALPLASNATAQGRAFNRRVEVEFWHDDPLQEMPEDVQLCPKDSDAAMVTKVHDPAWGRIAPLELEGGRAVIPAGYVDQLRRAMADVDGKTNVRLRFVGYTKNERIDRRTASVYGDDIGLSAARARRAMETIREQMALTPEQAEHEGRGYVHSDDVVNAGFTQGETSHVVVQVVYDERAVVDDLDGVDITKLTRELSPEDPFALNLMRITVDGKPIDDPKRSSADIQRCTDVALEEADIQFQFDSLSSSRRLSVAAAPSTIVLRDAAIAGEVPQAAPADDAGVQDAETEAPDAEPSESPSEEDEQEVAAHGDEEALTDAPTEPATAAGDEPAMSAGEAAGEAKTTSPVEPRYIGDPVRFRMYANYSAFIERSEVRIFTADQSPQAHPLDVIPFDANGFAEWVPTSGVVAAPARDLKYVLRAYDTKGNFDETVPQPLWLVYGHAGEVEPDQEKVKQRRDQELLAGYGDNALSVSNIRLGSGTVKVRGTGIPAQHTVWVAGRQVPVDHSGSFVAEEVLPSGMHTVEVAVLDEGGNGSMYLRDLKFERDDWFYLGLADVTVSEHRARGPVDLLQGENTPYDYDSTLDGRLAFYINGKFSEHWGLTASADTREGPVKDLFSNFLDKSPDSLFRRIDPDYHYPTFGDDAIVEEVAPTLGKFYVKVNRDQNHALWGNFRISYMGNELAHVDRGLYGGNLHFETEATTSFGEQRAAIDGFAAEPGTLASREEFRGTGGSLYFLRNQDILVGSERVRIELRDKDSGLVTGVKNLQPILDYDVDYLQGRILLAEPLNSTVDDGLLVRTGGLSGDEAHLVVRYEYTPGFDEIDAMATGGQAHYWINDYLRIGLTASTNEEGTSDSTLNGADVTVRMSADTFLKVQGAQSEGLVSSSLYSSDGGFDFVGDSSTGFDDADATAWRADLSIGFGEFTEALPGRITLYTQSQGAGYSAPGLTALTDTKYQGGTLNTELPFGVRLRAKADQREQDQGYSVNAQELDVGYQITERWDISTGVRKDEREYDGTLTPLNLQQGERTDAVVQLGYDSRSTWRTYGFVQETLSKSAEREEDSRVGVGGAYRFTDRFRADLEVSDGDLGPGARVGTNYQYSERTSLYLNYALENERTDNGLHGERGNLISGVKRKLSDASSVYLEQRYQETESTSGLTHATGMSLAPNDRWNLSANTDIGSLVDQRTGSKIDREAGGVSVGYGFETVQFSSAVEYRLDKTQQPDQTMAERTTWLYRNAFKYQLTPDWRVLGKFNHADSTSSLGQFYDGGYTEAVIGYGYRPVAHDRLNALAKYTYFFNVPTTEQVTPQHLPAQFIQKSHVGALDVTYDITDRWSLGGKYAYRLGQVSLDREDRQFFDNRAHLYIVRTDLTFGLWEGLIEGRMLDMTDLNEQRSGALAAVYRQLGDHVKVGIGYNFTDFSDDLTDLSFRHEGAFLNIIGAM
ncbi:flagellar motor protein MotB [Povalibacter uvarum]|uniref:Flagellar motor protein MotB n=1 Tax=Povalibacter uvarum TaxID=732238 RepID=A0A841HIG9_9GAMM|nr:OmpA family protein [Povalibacter uvarum]MBB6092374.1 flagellar motor protein MotB [Povalibacter uvarum]